MDINKLADVILNGELAIIPTDTVYGIVADATSFEAVDKVFKIKKRDYKKPLIIMVSSVEMLLKYVLCVDEIEKELIEKYWPGKLTILFKRNKNVLDIITNGGDLVGIRFPDNKELINLMNKIDRPLVSTSANISNCDTVVDINMIEEELKNKVSYIYDGGILDNLASTIVTIVGGKIKIIRDGELSSQLKNSFDCE